MKKIYKLNKVFLYLKKRLFFINITNKNLQNLAYREMCYKKLERKYKNTIRDFTPINSTVNNSDKIWFCWLQGIENAPKLVKKCYESIKENIPNREIIIITNENYSDYVSFPEYIIKKRNKGCIENAHFSDLLRLELLNKYGGLWIDSTVFISDKIDERFFENEMFVFKNISLYQKEELSVKASNWLIYARRNNNNILRLTTNLLLEYWKKNNNAINYHIFHLFFAMATKKFENEWEKVPTYSNIAPHILQFELNKEFTELRWKEIKEMSKFHKLNHRIITNDINSFYYKLINGELGNE